jgi:hypothetical protein
MHRPTLGVVSIVLCLIGAIVYFYFHEGGGAVLLRAGGLCGVIWLAEPQLQRVPQSVWIGIFMLGGVIVLFKRAALYVLPIAFILLILMTILRPRPPRR